MALDIILTNALEKKTHALLVSSKYKFIKEMF